MERDKQLEIKIDGDNLVVSIGIDLLCFAVQEGISNYGLDGFKIINNDGFCRDIQRRITMKKKSLVGWTWDNWDVDFCKKNPKVKQRIAPLIQNKKDIDLNTKVRITIEEI